MTERRELDAYYTPDALADALVRTLDPRTDGTGAVILEPHVGGGAFARAARRAWSAARFIGIDIDERAPGLRLVDRAIVGDFLEAALPARPDFVLGNPPYRAAQKHIERALEAVAPVGGRVAFLLRLGFLESERRIAFWRAHRPKRVWVLSERPSFTGGGTDNAAYGWYLWEHGWQGDTMLGWISWRGSNEPRCRRGSAALADYTTW